MAIRYRLSFSVAAIMCTVAAIPTAQAIPVFDVESVAMTGMSSSSLASWGDDDYRKSVSEVSENGGNATAFAYSHSSGSYTVGGVVNGDGLAQATASYHYELLNTTGQAQIYKLWFTIYGGSISTLLNEGATMDRDFEFMQASYSADIMLNGDKASRYQSQATLYHIGGTPMLWLGGELLNSVDDGSDGEYSWSDSYVYREYLLAADETLNINTYSYALAYNQLNPKVDSCGFDETALVQERGSLLSEPSCFKGSSRSFFGDPLNSQDSIGFSYTYSPANAVSEPSGFVLAGLGLGLIVLARRRRTFS